MDKTRTALMESNNFWTECRPSPIPSRIVLHFSGYEPSMAIGGSHLLIPKQIVFLKNKEEHDMTRKEIN